jgi:hypothetical protein
MLEDKEGKTPNEDIIIRINANISNIRSNENCFFIFKYDIIHREAFLQHHIYELCDLLGFFLKNINLSYKNPRMTFTY